MSLESDEDPNWQKLVIPPGVAASPVMNDDTVALILKGKTIDQVAAFSTYIGKWRTQQLRKAAEDEIIPYVLPGGAVYQVGNDIYAFSSFVGAWDVLHLEGAEKPRVNISTKDIEVLHGNRLYVFSLKHGRFASGVDVNPRPFQPDPRKATPAR